MIRVDKDKVYVSGSGNDLIIESCMAIASVFGRLYSDIDDDDPLTKSAFRGMAYDTVNHALQVTFSHGVEIEKLPVENEIDMTDLLRQILKEGE